MICDLWDVAVVPFPFTDLALAKSRPALLLSPSTFNATHGNSILAMITRAKRSTWPTDHPIQDIAAAGLRHPCIVRRKLFTLDNRLLQRRIGSFGDADRAACRRILQIILPC